eukprot:XP_001693271.1 predicted protein [Chlamydomonas reinhardtii]
MCGWATIGAAGCKSARSLKVTLLSTHECTCYMVARHICQTPGACPQQPTVASQRASGRACPSPASNMDETLKMVRSGCGAVTDSTIGQLPRREPGSTSNQACPCRIELCWCLLQTSSVFQGVTLCNRNGSCTLEAHLTLC